MLASRRKETSSDGPRHKIADALLFYLDSKLFSDLVHHTYVTSDTDKSGSISKEEFDAIMNIQNITQADANRIWKAVLNEESDQIDWSKFLHLSELLYDEAISIATFTYLSKNNKRDRKSHITKDSLEEGLKELWDSLDQPYPFPKSSVITPLTDKCDKDKDGKLDLEEFFIFFSTFLRYYKTLAANWGYGNKILKDDFISKIWAQEEKERKHRKWAEFWSSNIDSFYKYAIYEYPFIDLAQDLFDEADADDSKTINKLEFARVMSRYQIEEKEVDFLWHIADVDHDGLVTFAEFCVLLETFIHRSIAEFSWDTIVENKSNPNITTVEELITTALNKFNLTLDAKELSSEFKTKDEDKDGVLTYEEFAELVSGFLSKLKLSLQEKEAQATQANAKLKKEEIHEVKRSEENFAYDENLQKDVEKAEKKDEKALKEQEKNKENETEDKDKK